MTKKRWTLEFSDEDWLVVELTVDRGKVKAFVLNYVAHIQGEIRETVRYDTKHGYLHLHRFWLDEDRRVEDLEDPEEPADDYSAMFSRAAQGLRTRWRAYRQSLNRKLRESGGKHDE